MGKQARSFSIDSDLNELLTDREDINASAVVNNFLREYVANGRGTDAALETRISQLDEEISDLEKSLTRKERERERLESQLDRRRDDVLEIVDKVVDRVESQTFPRENLTEENEAVKRWAGEAGIPVSEFISKVESRL